MSICETSVTLEHTKNKEWAVPVRSGWVASGINSGIHWCLNCFSSFAREGLRVKISVIKNVFIFAMVLMNITNKHISVHLRGSGTCYVAPSSVISNKTTKDIETFVLGIIYFISDAILFIRRNLIFLAYVSDISV